VAGVAIELIIIARMTEYFFMGSPYASVTKNRGIVAQDARERRQSREMTPAIFLNNFPCNLVFEDRI
jgi:hypothetical protein